MRKSTPFVSIPTVPMTVSEQWLTFSHMANHYRKILNVKSRVDSAAPKVSSMERAPKPSLRKALRKQISTPVETDGPKVKKKIIPSQRPKRPQNIINDKEFQALSEALESPRSSICRVPKTASEFGFGSSKYKQRQTVFTDESDIENHRRIDGMQTMGIAEKIKLYLDQIQDNDLNNNRSIDRPLTRACANRGRDPVKSREELNETYLARHSRCFTPTSSQVFGSDKQSNKKQQNWTYMNLVDPVLGTPKKVQKPKINSKSTLGHPCQSRKSLRNPSERCPKTAPGNITSTNLTNINRNLEPVYGRAFDNNTKRKSQPLPVHAQNCRSQSPGSISARTLRGSDELTESRLLPLTSNAKTSIANHNRSSRSTNHEMNNIEAHDFSSAWLQEKVDKGLIQINNAYFLGDETRQSVLGIHNNKDSSRDSAYGFSSGESRITTTRESTPEQRANSSKASKAKSNKYSPDIIKYKSSLSTVASSTIQDSPSRSGNKFEPTLEEYELQQLTKQCNSGSNWMDQDRYISFLTAVTDDVVSRGIYTNKGLKNLFQSHIDKNPSLDKEKMSNMLNRLRMDLGIPKDDSLNQLDFGYGSIKYSAPPFYYNNHILDKSLELKDDLRVGTKQESDYSLQELHHRSAMAEDYQSSDEGRVASSISTNPSVINGSSFDGRPNPPANNSVSRISSQSSRASTLSLTESEITCALKEVGFDSESAQDIMSIINNRSKSKPKQRSLGLPQHQPSAFLKSNLVNSNRSNLGSSAESC